MIMGWGDYVGRQPILENLRNYVAFLASRQLERQPDLLDSPVFVAFLPPCSVERQPDLLDSPVFVAFLASRFTTRHAFFASSKLIIVTVVTYSRKHARSFVQAQPRTCSHEYVSRCLHEYVQQIAPCFALSQFDTKIRIPYYRTPCSFRFVSLKKAALSLQAGSASFFETDLFT